MSKDSQKTLNDALILIQSADEFILSDGDEVKKMNVNALVVALKDQLHIDNNLAIDFFDAVDPTVLNKEDVADVPKELNEETLDPENPELTEKALGFYAEIQALITVTAEKTAE